MGENPRNKPYSMEENEMKKILALLLAAVMVLGLCACGSNGGTNGGDSTKGSDSTVDSKTKVSVFWYDESDV